MSTRNLLAFIRSKEAPRGYDQMYGRAEALVGRHALTKMTLGEVFALQRKVLAAGSPSSALGGYQFITKTLGGLCTEMGLHAPEVFTAELQDRMAVKLLERRGLNDFMTGRLSREGFANNLAKEWASLPVVTRIQGQKRMVDPGQSYYAGDGLNKALTSPEAVLALLDDIRRPQPDVEPIDTPDTQAPSMWWTGFMALLRFLFIPQGDRPK